MADHSSKVALITGSTSGIGLATAHALASRGVNVIITGFGDQATIDSIINDIKTKHSVKVHYLSADLSKSSDIESLWAEIVKIYPDGVDILVNNAGLGHYSSIDNYPNDKWDCLIAVMLSAPFHLTKHCLPAMKKKGWGRIVNIASVAGVVGTLHTAAYVASKHGIIGLTKATALETASFGITCNAVCPAITETAMLDRKKLQPRAEELGVSYEQYEKAMLKTALTGHFNKPEQVAELIEFLSLSNASSQITGSSYLIDQGHAAH